MSPTAYNNLPEELEQVRTGRLPSRYGLRMQDAFIDRLRPLLIPGVSILDVGAGRRPTVPRESRPVGCHYVGLDISEDELAAAGRHAYDETLVCDVAGPFALEGTFDVVISWQVLEHVRPIDRALENLRLALRPAGTLLAQLSGTFAAFALMARIMPHRIRSEVMARLLGHPQEMKFPTHYHRCHATALEGMLTSWTAREIVPFYRGAVYFGIARPLQRAYLVYEDLLERHQIRNLATHYLVTARR